MYVVQNISGFSLIINGHGSTISMGYPADYPRGSTNITIDRRSGMNLVYILSGTWDDKQLEEDAFSTCYITYTSRNNFASNYISDLFFSVAEHHSVLTRSSRNANLHLPKPALKIFKSSHSYSGANL